MSAVGSHHRLNVEILFVIMVNIVQIIRQCNHAMCVFTIFPTQTQTLCRLSVTDRCHVLLQVMYFSSLFPYVVLICFLVRALLLKGSVDGIRHMFTPKVQWLNRGFIFIHLFILVILCAKFPKGEKKTFMLSLHQLGCLLWKTGFYSTTFYTSVDYI